MSNVSIQLKSDFVRLLRIQQIGGGWMVDLDTVWVGCAPDDAENANSDCFPWFLTAPAYDRGGEAAGEPGRAGNGWMRGGVGRHTITRCVCLKAFFQLRSLLGVFQDVCVATPSLGHLVATLHGRHAQGKSLKENWKHWSQRYCKAC